MEQKRLERCVARLSCTWPLVGGWIQRRAVRRLAKDGSPQAIGALARAAIGAVDPAIRASAWETIRNVTEPSCVAAVCAVWAETRDPELASLLWQRRWVADAPAALHILTALHSGRDTTLHDSKPDLIGPLVDALADRDPAFAGKARQILLSLTRADARETLCRIVIEQDSSSACTVAATAGYVPKDDLHRAVFFVLTGQWDRYDTLDFDRLFLRSAFAAAPPALRQRLLAALRATGRADLLSATVGLGEAGFRAAALSDTDLEAVIAMLHDHRQWERLWNLAFEVSLVWSARVVRMLGNAGWTPDDADARGAFTQLRQLARQELPDKSEAIAALVPVAVCLAQARVKGNVNSVAIAAHRPVIAIGTGHRRIALWDFQRGGVEWTRGGFGHSIGRVAFGTDGQLFCGERTNGSDPCGLFVCRDGDCRNIAVHNGSVTGIEAVDESHVMSCGRDQRVALWNIADGRCIASREFDFWARSLKLSPDRRHAALAHSGLAVIDAATLNLVQDGDDAFAGVARTVCFSPDAQSVVAGKVNGQVLAFPLDAERRRRARRLELKHGSEITGLAALPGRSVLVSADANGQINFTAWPQETRVGQAVAAAERLTSLHISADEAFMVTGDSDHQIAFWDIRGLELPVLLSQPLARATPTHLAVAAAFQQAKDLPDVARRALAFLEVLLRYRFRYEIEIDDVALIKPGEFDIDIE